MGKISLNMSGVVMTGAFVIVLVAGVIFLPGGGLTSLAAALAIAVGFAGAGYGILRIARSGGAAERAQASPTVDRVERQRRARRSLLVQSILSLVSGVLFFVMLLITGPGREGSTIRFALLGAALIALGIGGLIVAARAGQHRAESNAAPANPETDERDADTTAAAGWQLVTRRDLRSVLTVIAPGAGVVLFTAWQASSFLYIATRTMSEGAAIAVFVVVIALVVVIVIVVVRRVPQVWIDVATRRVRSGSTTVSWDEITAARLSGAAAIVGGPRSLVLTLEGPHKLGIPLILRRRGELTMTPPQRQAALAMIEGARIAVPRAPEDPNGRFSNVHYPTHLDAAQARQLVARPPRSDEDLPVAIG